MILYSKEQDGTMNVHVTGYLTKDPKITEKVVLFSVCYGKKKYMDCKAWKNEKQGEIASLLERHDVVSVDGTMDSYTDRDGKERSQLSVDGIFVMQIAAPVSDASGLPPSSSTFEELAGEDESDLPF